MEAPSPVAEQADAEGIGRAALAGEDEALPIPRLRQALDDLFTPNPIRYWVDFFASALCFYVGFMLVALSPLPLPAGRKHLADDRFMRRVVFRTPARRWR